MDTNKDFIKKIFEYAVQLSDSDNALECSMIFNDAVIAYENKLAEHSLQRNKEIFDECAKAKQRIEDLEGFINSIIEVKSKANDNQGVFEVLQEIDKVKTALNNKQK